MHRIQPREVHIAPVHHVEGTGFDGQDIQHLDIVQLAVADVDERRDRTTQIQLRVQLDGCLGRPSVEPRVDNCRAAQRTTCGKLPMT